MLFIPVDAIKPNSLLYGIRFYMIKNLLPDFRCTQIRLSVFGSKDDMYPNLNPAHIFLPVLFCLILLKL